MKKSLLMFMAAIAALALAGCGGSLNSRSVAHDPIPITVTTASGLQYQDLKVGTGREASASDIVTINYILYRIDDTKVESTMDPGGQPVEITLGRKEMTLGIDEGIQGMRAGGHRRLIVPPELAFGDTGKAPNIPGGVSVIYYIELVAVGPWTTLDDGLKYTELQEGSGAEVTGDDTVSVKYTGYLANGKKIASMDKSSTPVVMTLGLKEHTEGMDLGIVGMKVGGKRRLWIPYNLAYGTGGKSPDIPSYSNLVIEVEVVNIREWTTLPSGLKYIDTTIGAGDSPGTYDNASFSYTTWLLATGARIDSSNGSPVKLTLGTTQAIPGIDEGLRTVKVGGTRRLMIPPELGYGDTDHGSVPAGSTMIIEVELMQVESPVTTASGLKYFDYTLGTGEFPNVGDMVSANYTGWLLDGTQFDTSEGSSPYEFIIGTGAVIPGWDEGILSMKVGGSRKLIIPPALGYGDAGNPPTIPGDSWLVFEVRLESITAP